MGLRDLLHGEALAVARERNRPGKPLSGFRAFFDRDDSWSGLTATVNLFRRLTIATSEMLNFAYPQTVDGNLTRFILQIKEEQQ